MTSKKLFPYVLVPILCAVLASWLLTACGGGGGDSGVQEATLIWGEGTWDLSKWG